MYFFHRRNMFGHTLTVVMATQQIIVYREFTRVASAVSLQFLCRSEVTQNGKTSLMSKLLLALVPAPTAPWYFIPSEVTGNFSSIGSQSFVVCLSACSKYSEAIDFCVFYILPVYVRSPS